MHTHLSISNLVGVITNKQCILIYQFQTFVGVFTNKQCTLIYQFQILLVLSPTNNVHSSINFKSCWCYNQQTMYTHLPISNLCWCFHQQNNVHSSTYFKSSNLCWCYHQQTMQSEPKTQKKVNSIKKLHRFGSDGVFVY